MAPDTDALDQPWDPWRFIPLEYNLGVALTRGQVEKGLGELVAWGLVTRVVSHEQLLEEATDVLVACCGTAPGARTDIKRELDAYYGLYDRIGMKASLGEEEAMEGWRAFKERRPPSWIHPDLRPEGRM